MPYCVGEETSRLPGSSSPSTQEQKPCSFFLDQFVAVLERVQVSEEDPFAHLVAVEVEPCAVIFRVPLDFAVVGLGKLQGIRRADIFGGWIWLFAAGSLSFVGAPVYQ